MPFYGVLYDLKLYTECCAKNGSRQKTYSEARAAQKSAFLRSPHRTEVHAAQKSAPYRSPHRTKVRTVQKPAPHKSPHRTKVRTAQKSAPYRRIHIFLQRFQNISETEKNIFSKRKQALFFVSEQQFCYYGGQSHGQRHRSRHNKRFNCA